jgi:hypothetical protein
MKYTTEQLEAIAAKLRDLPPAAKRIQEHSKKEAVALLAREITALQKRGYTLVQIAESLRGEGLDIATPTLKAYILSTKPKRKVSPPTEKPATAKKSVGNKKPAPSGFAVSTDTDDI